MKKIRIALVLFCMQMILVAEPRTAEEWNINFEQARRSEMSPEEKEAVLKHNKEITDYQERLKQQKNENILQQSTSSKKTEDVESVLKAKGFKIDWEKEEEEQYELEEAERQKNKQKQDQERQKAQEAKLKEEVAKKAASKDEGFDFTEDENEPKLVKHVESKDASSWTDENVAKIDPKDFANLKTEDLEKLFKNSSVLRALSLDQVRNINPKELSNVIGIFKAKVDFPDSFVEKLSGNQINQLLSDHTGGTLGYKGWFKNFDSYFSKAIRKQLDDRQKEYKKYGGRVADLMQDARLIHDKKLTIQNFENEISGEPLAIKVQILKIIDPEKYKRPDLPDPQKDKNFQNQTFLNEVVKLSPQEVALMNKDQIVQYLQTPMPEVSRSGQKNKDTQYDFIQYFNPEYLADAMTSKLDLAEQKNYALTDKMLKMLTDDQVAAIIKKTDGSYTKINPRIITESQFNKLT